LVLCAIVFGSIFGIIATLNRVSCHQFGETLGKKVIWNLSDCYVLENGRWIPKQYLFGNAIENRIKVEK
jgi:hypothetical protein